MFRSRGGSNLDRETHGRCDRRRTVAGSRPLPSRSARWGGLDVAQSVPGSVPMGDPSTVAFVPSLPPPPHPFPPLPLPLPLSSSSPVPYHCDGVGQGTPSPHSWWAWPTQLRNHTGPSALFGSVGVRPTGDEPGCEPSATPHSNGPSTARSDEWPAWFSFWFSGCWRALAKWHGVGGFCGVFSSLSGEPVRHLAPGREDDH